ncbi:MAG: FAD:protein FMN transferase [Myxococcota bacterium]
MGSLPQLLRGLPGRRVASGLAAGLLALVAALLLLGGSAGAEPYRDSRELMGTLLQLTLVHPDVAVAREAAEACFAEGAALEAVLTTYDAESATSRMNAGAGSGPFQAPPALARILAESKALQVATGGAFDVTVGPLIELWTEAGQAGRLPGPSELGAALRRVGSDRIVLGPEGVVMLQPGMGVNFGAVGKGFALDRMAERLAEHGVSRALLDFGGSSWLALGAPEGGAAWRVLLRDGRGGFAGVVSLRDASLSFSESMAGTTEIGGRRYGHVIDPRSGWPLEEPIAAAALAADGTTAEALSTALVVLGPEHGLGVVGRLPGAEALVIDASGSRHESRGFRETTGFEPVAAVAPGTAP